MEGSPKGKAGSKQRDKVKDHFRGQEEESEDIFAHFCFSRCSSTLPYTKCSEEEAGKENASLIGARTGEGARSKAGSSCLNKNW